MKTRQIKTKKTTKGLEDKKKINFSIKKCITKINTLLLSIKALTIKNKKKIFVFAVCLLAIFVVVWINNIYILIKYKPYTEKVKTWGMEELYLNGKATSYQKVSRLDAVRIVLGLTLNIEDISGLESSKEANFKSENWAKVAQRYNIIEKDEVIKKNYKKTASMQEVSIYLTKSKAKVIKLAFSDQTFTIDSKNIQKIKEENKGYINEAIAIGLLDIKDLDLNKKINKGMLNKMIVEFSEKTSAIHYDRSVSIETDSKNLPKTYKQYPYIVKGIDKEIYDMPLKGDKEINFNTPITVYKTRKDIYEQTEQRIKQYYNAILNVDYKTIDSDKLRDVIEEYSLYSNNPGHYINYARYVQNHKIQLKGDIQTYLPIIYYDGVDYRVRTKITFEILSSDTQENLLLPDIITGGRVTYLDKKYTMYADVMLSQSYNSMSQRICIFPINNMLVSPTDRIVQK